MSESVLRLWDSGVELNPMDGRRVQPAVARGTGSSRMVWQLFSPSFRLIVCSVWRTPSGFALRVTCGDDVLASCEAATLESLHDRAAEWRMQLESHGYMASASVPASARRPAARPSEARAAFIGLIECASLLGLRQPDAGRELRDRATEALVALGLSDNDLLTTSMDAARCVLARASAGDADCDLIRSANVLLDRVEGQLGRSPSKGVS